MFSNENCSKPDDSKWSDQLGTRKAIMSLTLIGICNCMAKDTIVCNSCEVYRTYLFEWWRVGSMEVQVFRDFYTL